jgi:hypothetical protein
MHCPLCAFSNAVNEKMNIVPTKNGISSGTWMEPDQMNALRWAAVYWVSPLIETSLSIGCLTTVFQTEVNAINIYMQWR